MVACCENKDGEHPGDHNHQDFPKTTAIQMGSVLQYKWEAYCDTNGRSTDSISLSSEGRVTESTAIQIGGVLQYKLEVYFDTFWRSSGGLGFWHSSERRKESLTRQRVLAANPLQHLLEQTRLSCSNGLSHSTWLRHKRVLEWFFLGPLKLSQILERAAQNAHTHTHTHTARTHTHTLSIYICIYIYICCGVIIWATFGGF